MNDPALGPEPTPPPGRVEAGAGPAPDGAGPARSPLKRTAWWLLVLIPLAWGVSQSVVKSLPLLRPPAPTAEAVGHRPPDGPASGAHPASTASSAPSRRSSRPTDGGDPPRGDAGPAPSSSRVGQPPPLRGPNESWSHDTSD